MCCRDGGNTFTPERYRLEQNSAHTFTGRQAPQRPTHSFWSFLSEKTKLECGKKPPAFRQRQAHFAVRHAARSRPAHSAPGHRARTRASSRIYICTYTCTYYMYNSSSGQPNDCWCSITVVHRSTNRFAQNLRFTPWAVVGVLPGDRLARHVTRGTNRGSERQSVSHPASGCLRGKDQTQEGMDPQGTDPHRGRPHRGRPTHRERPTQGARPTQETHRQV